MTTCPKCRKIFFNTTRARVVQSPVEPRRFLLIPIPDQEDWSLPDMTLHMNLGFAKLLKVSWEAMVQLGAFAGAAKDRRGEQMLNAIATWLSGLLEYTDPKDISSFERVIDKHKEGNYPWNQE
jgi:hypothetical protein